MKRKYNLDLLRIVSMIGIVSLHYLGVGGAYYNIVDGNLSNLTFNYSLASFLEALSIVSVNCFVMISGYFLCEKEFKWKKILKLAIEVWVYSILISGIMFVINPQNISLNNLVRTFLPILLSSYWFITTYIVLYILSPFINIVIEKLDKKGYIWLLIIMVSIFSVWNSVLPIAETVDSSKGYSITWFITLYLIGAYIKKYGINLFKNKKYIYLICFFGFSFLLVGIKLACILVSTKYSLVAQLQNYYYHYNSIIVLLSSMCLFMYFESLTINKGKIISFISPSVFAVYLIHEHFLLREVLWADLIKVENFKNSNFFLVHYIVSVLIVFGSFVLIDKLKRVITKLFSKMFKRKIVNA